MEIERSAYTAAAGSAVSELSSSSSGQDERIAELQRLEQSLYQKIRECQSSAKSSDSARNSRQNIQQYKDLIAKIDRQILDLKKQDSSSSKSKKTAVLSVSHYNSALTRIAADSAGGSVLPEAAAASSTAAETAQISPTGHSQNTLDLLV